MLLGALATKNAWMVLLLAGFSVGCEVTAEKITTWKDTERGPGKLRDAVKSSSVSGDLRGLAWSALIEIGMATEAEEDWKALSDADKKAVAHAAFPSLKTLAMGAEGGDKTTRKQRNAKDGLFVLRDAADPADKTAIDDLLISWVAVDLAGRSSEGGHSTEQILTAIGARAGNKLVEVIGDSRTSDASRMMAATLIGKIGDKPAREQAGVKLVEIARREKTIQESTLQEVGLVGGDHATAFLTQLAEDGKTGDKIRQKALFSLAQGTDPAALPAALRVAGDKKAAGEIRDAAFELAEKIGPSAQPGLIKLMDDKDEQVRWRAVEAALKAGKDKAVVPVLEALSTSGSYPKEDLRSFVVHDLELIGPGALPPLRTELQSKSWVARIAAIEGIGAIGKADDAARVEALGSDGAKLKGWAGGASIGSEAKVVAAALKGKH
jgi:HEAT repeat protein